MPPNNASQDRSGNRTQAVNYGFLLRVTILLIRRHWRHIVATTLLYTLSGLFAINALAVVVLAVDLLLGDVTGSFSAAFGPLSDPIQTMQTQLGDDAFFLILVVLAVLSQIARSLLEVAGIAASIGLRARVEADTKRRLFRYLTRQPYQHIQQYKTGYFVAQFNYADRAGIYTFYVAEIVGAAIIATLYFTVLLWLSNVTTLILLVCILGVGVAILRVIRAARRAAQEALNARIQLNEQVLEMVQGLSLIRIFAREHYSERQIDQLVTQGQRYLIRGKLWQSIITPMTQISSILLVAVFLLVGYATLVQTGEESPLTQVVAFIFVLWQTTPRLSAVSVTYAKLIQEWHAVDLLSQILLDQSHDKPDNQHADAHNQAAPPPPSTLFPGFKQVLTFDQVTLQYTGHDEASVQELSFDIRRGEMIAFVGHSGAGKSTVLNLLLRLYEPSTGQILVDGVDLRTYDVGSWRQCISVVNQEAFLFNNSVYDNILFGNLEATQADIIRAAKAANAHDFIIGLPQGYNTVIGNRGDFLSGGQRQRIALARALVRNVDILVLDEATSNLDSESEQLIQESLERLRGKMTLLVVAHRLSTVKQADKIFVLQDGRLVETGNHHDLLQQSGDYANFWQLQTT